MIKYIHYFCIHFIVFGCLHAQNGHLYNPAAAGISESKLDRYERFLDSEISAGKMAGAVSLIQRKGQTAHFEAIGYSNLSEKQPMNKDQIFYIQSMTKPVISVAFMTLYEEGHFLLTDPVSMYLPEFDSLEVMQLKYDDDGTVSEVEYVAPRQPVLIWHLLAHTAGFSHGLGQNEYDQKLFELLYETTHKTIKDRVKALLSYPLMGHPGKQWNYSASPDVLALLIEYFSGMPVDRFLQQRIFDPLEMTDTGYNVDMDDEHRIAGLHQPGENGQLESAEEWSASQNNTVFGGTHGLYSTASDYAKFGQMLLNGGKYNGHRIISRKTLELMTENHIEGLPYSPGQGFGLGFGVSTDVSDSKLPGSVGTYYWSGAFNTYFFVDPVEEAVGILMTQSYPYTNFYGTKLRQFLYSAIDD